MIPVKGDVVRVGPGAGIQYRFCEPFNFHVTQVEEPGHSPDGSVWLTGYEIGADGLAVEDGHHEIWIQNHTGLDLIHRPARTAVVARRPVNRGPVRIPAQRRPSSVSTSTTRSIR